MSNFYETQVPVVEYYEHLLPPTGWVRLTTILKIILISAGTWHRKVKQGKFPEGIQTDCWRFKLWHAEDIRQLIKKIKDNNGYL